MSGQWFPTLDDAVGGTADVIEDSGDWVLGGIGSTISNTVEGATGTAADSAGNLFSPIVNTYLKIGGMVLLAVVAIKVI